MAKEFWQEYENQPQHHDEDGELHRSGAMHESSGPHMLAAV